MRLRLLVGVGVLALVAGTSAWLVRSSLHAPLQLPASGYVLDVPAGSSLQAVTRQLAAEGLLELPFLLHAYARLTGAARSIKAGEYEIPAGTTPLGLLRQLVDGRVKLHGLTIVEGWTSRDLARAVRRHPAISPSADVTPGSMLSAAMGDPEANPEGWFFPDTYRFPRGTPGHEILRIAHERMKTVLERVWNDRSADLPLSSAYEALILASIVEKETRLDQERPRIAGVFIRRLKAGMRLQTDPTVIYGLGEAFDGNLTRRHLAQDTPYNTYARAGLPPSPISLPGESSLLAAVHPDDSDALYFVASGDEDGSHVFSATLREHNAAVRRYLATIRGEGK